MPKLAAFGEVMMRLETPGYELLAQSDRLRYSFSGTGVNVMSALSRYGHEAHLVSRLPDSPLGEAAEAYLRKLGVGTRFVQHGGRYLGLYFLEPGFGARPSRVTYSNRLESSFNTAPVEAYSYADLAQQLDVVHFCGITLAMNEAVRLAMKSFARAVKERGGTVVFDCNYRPSLWGEGGYSQAKPHYEEMLGLADVVLMNEQDALYILGMKTSKQHREEQLAELIPLVAERYNLRAVAGTYREVHDGNRHSLQGYLYQGGAFSFSERLSFAVYDRIGAGDAFASGIIHGELTGMGAKETVAFATAAGMLAHTVAGDTPMASAADILRAMTSPVRDVDR